MKNILNQFGAIITVCVLTLIVLTVLSVLVAVLSDVGHVIIFLF